MTFEEAVQRQQELQQSGAPDDLIYYGVQFHDEDGESDLSNPWLRVDTDTNTQHEGVPPDEDVNEDDYVTVMGAAGPPRSSNEIPSSESATVREHVDDDWVDVGGASRPSRSSNIRSIAPDDSASAPDRHVKELSHSV